MWCRRPIGAFYGQVIAEPWWSTSSDECGDNVSSAAVEVLAAMVVDGRGPGVGVAGGELNLAQGHPGIERGHDERGPEHVGVDCAQPGPPSD
jgi:hypothetical protein